MYRELQDFAPNIDNDYSRDPVYYCTTEYLDSQFLHGAQGRTFGKYNKHCSEFLAARCAANWDHICEKMSNDQETRFPNTASPLGAPYSGFQDYASLELTYGEQLLRDTAFKKYKVKSFDCNLKCELFDPTVPNSPLVCYETRTADTYGSNPSNIHLGDVEGGVCSSTYKITPEQSKVLDSDPVMNRLLARPQLAMDLLEEIYRTMKAEGSLILLRNTKLGNFYRFTGHPL